MNGEACYWGGPYDGAKVAPSIRDLPVQMGPSGRLYAPADPRYNDRGHAFILPLGACELYLWCVRHERYEWRGTFAPDSSGSYVPLSQVEG